MERRIEARDLGHARQARQHRADRREVVRLVQRRERHVLIEALQHGDVDGGRRHELEAAVHDAMSDAHDACRTEFRLDHREQAIERVRVGHRTRSERRIDERPAISPRRESGHGANSRHLSAQVAHGLPVDEPEDAELDARRARVQHQDRAFVASRHDHHLSGGVAARRA